MTDLVRSFTGGFTEQSMKANPAVRRVRRHGARDARRDVGPDDGIGAGRDGHQRPEATGARALRFRPCPPAGGLSTPPVRCRVRSGPVWHGAG